MVSPASLDYQSWADSSSFHSSLFGQGRIIPGPDYLWGGFPWYIGQDTDNPSGMDNNLLLYSGVQIDLRGNWKEKSKLNKNWMRFGKEKGDRKHMSGWVIANTYLFCPWLQLLPRHHQVRQHQQHSLLWPWICRVQVPSVQEQQTWYLWFPYL